MKYEYGSEFIEYLETQINKFPKLEKQVFSELIGKVIIAVMQIKDEVYFLTGDGFLFVLYHPLACCESVELEEVYGGKLEDLIGKTIVRSTIDVVDNSEETGWGRTSFYTLRTNEDTITMRWVGQSNGSYGVDVNCGVYSFLTPKVFITQMLIKTIQDAMESHNKPL